MSVFRYIIKIIEYSTQTNMSFHNRVPKAKPLQMGFHGLMKVNLGVEKMKKFENSQRTFSQQTQSFTNKLYDL